MAARKPVKLSSIFLVFGTLRPGLEKVRKSKKNKQSQQEKWKTCISHSTIPSERLRNSCSDHSCKAPQVTVGTRRKRLESRFEAKTYRIMLVGETSALKIQKEFGMERKTAALWTPELPSQKVIDIRQFGINCISHRNCFCLGHQLDLRLSGFH